MSERSVQLNVRLPEATVEALRLVADIEGVNVRDLVAEGVDHVLSTRREDGEWRQRLAEREDALRDAFDALR